MAVLGLPRERIVNSVKALDAVSVLALGSVISDWFLFRDFRQARIVVATESGADITADLEASPNAEDGTPTVIDLTATSVGDGQASPVIDVGFPYVRVKASNGGALAEDAHVFLEVF